MDNWNLDYHLTHKENTEQRSSSLDPTSQDEPQRAATATNTLGDPQNSETPWSPSYSKNNINKKLNQDEQPPSYETHRKSAPYDESLQFFGDSNATDTKNYPSRSLLDQDSLQRGAISTLPSAGDRRRSSLERSALPGFEPREGTMDTAANEEVPIGKDALNGTEKVSPSPIYEDQPSTHEPLGFSMQDQDKDQIQGQGQYQNQYQGQYQNRDQGQYQNRDQGQYQNRDQGQYQSRDQSQDQEKDKGQGKSYSDMATDAVASVTATASAAAAALFGSQGGKYSTPNEAMPGGNSEDLQTRSAFQPTNPTTMDKGQEPAMHGQSPCFTEKDECCEECVPDQQHAFCSDIKEPVIHGQQACTSCNSERPKNASDQSQNYGTATIFGTSAAGTDYLYASDQMSPNATDHLSKDMDTSQDISIPQEIRSQDTSTPQNSTYQDQGRTNQPLSARDNVKQFNNFSEIKKSHSGLAGGAIGGAAAGAAAGGLTSAFSRLNTSDRNRDQSTPYEDKLPMEDRDMAQATSPYGSNERSQYMDQEASPYGSNERSQDMDQEASPYNSNERSQGMDQEASPYGSNERSQGMDQETNPYNSNERSQDMAQVTSPYGSNEGSQGMDQETSPYGSNERSQGMDPYGSNERSQYMNRETNPYGSNEKSRYMDQEASPYGSNERSQDMAQVTSPYGSNEGSQGIDQATSPYGSNERSQGIAQATSPYGSNERSQDMDQEISPYDSNERSQGMAQATSPYGSNERSQGLDQETSPYGSNERSQGMGKDMGSYDNDAIGPYNTTDKGNQPEHLGKSQDLSDQSNMNPSDARNYSNAPTNATDSYDANSYGDDRAFGSGNTFENKPIPPPKSQNYMQVPGKQSEGLSDNADNFERQDMNKPRRGSIKKVIDKIFHKHPKS